MQSCTFTLSVLLLLTTVCESATPTVKVEFNGTAVLPCSGRCSGVVRWTVTDKPTDPLAECDQTSCRSVKEGYQMIYNQYLQGDLSLIITEADFSKRALYTCDCDGRDQCDVELQIEALKTTVHKKVGEVLDINISDRVEVIYSSTDPGGPSNIRICRVERRSVEFRSDYEERASVTSALELRELKESDSGVYTVRDTLTQEIIYIYTVIVHGVSGDSGAHENKQDSGDSRARDQGQKPSDPNSTPSPGQGAALPVWVFVVFAVLGLLVVLGVASGVGNVVQWRKNQRLQGESQNNRAQQNDML